MLIGNIIFRKKLKSEFPANATCVLSRSYGVQEPCPTSSTLVSDHIEGCHGEMVLTGFTVQRNTLSYTGSPPRSLTVGQECFQLLPQPWWEICPAPLTRSHPVPQVFKDIHKAAGWGLQGQVWGMDQSKVKWPVQGPNLWPWPLRHLQTQLTELSKNPPFTGFICNIETLRGCGPPQEEEYSDQEGFPSVTCPLTYILGWYGVRTKHIFKNFMQLLKATFHL